MTQEWTTPLGATLAYEPADTARAVLAGHMARARWIDGGHLRPLLEWLSERVRSIFIPGAHEALDVLVYSPSRRADYLDAVLGEPLILCAFANHIMEADALSVGLMVQCEDYISLVVSGGCACLTCEESRAREALSPLERKSLEELEGEIWIDPDCEVRAIPGAARLVVEQWWPMREGVDMDSPWWAYQLARVHQRVRGREARRKEREREERESTREILRQEGLL